MIIAKKRIVETVETVETVGNGLSELVCRDCNVCGIAIALCSNCN